MEISCGAMVPTMRKFGGCSLIFYSVCLTVIEKRSFSSYPTRTNRCFRAPEVSACLPQQLLFCSRIISAGMSGRRYGRYLYFAKAHSPGRWERTKSIRPHRMAFHSERACTGGTLITWLGTVDDVLGYDWLARSHLPVLCAFATCTVGTLFATMRCSELSFSGRCGAPRCEAAKALSSQS